MKGLKKIELTKRTLSDVLDCIIDISVKDFDASSELAFTEFSNLISLGELIDRLTIVNIKLFNLKNEVMRNQGVSPDSPSVSDEWFRNAAVYDVRLCEERSRIKACIDKKTLAMIRGGAVPIEEYKSYK